MMQYLQDVVDLDKATDAEHCGRHRGDDQVLLRIPFYPRSGCDRGTAILENRVGPFLLHAKDSSVDVVLQILKK